MNREQLPAWAVEPVHLVEHDPTWAAKAARYAGEVRALFTDRLLGEVLHVGSTAVPGLPAKPIVDLQARAEHPATAVAAVVGAAGTTGWRFVPRELDDRPWRWFFVRVDDEEQTRLAHLHLMPPGEPRWDQQIRFRDRLRAEPDLRAEYAALKRRSAEAHHDDREAYTASKQAFIRRAT
ncbi:GrpB family protein [Actinomycetospora termitidis]|uniref:GrpB family protein n=1 Tax=Actinomycetospora termitidis TaxID=3053470 RepID=A0ABT7MCR2_9PSEU|nr:GrpB family protein [Actinomycetospora sp. Odt1-22]MDL5158465.1 GrpB family protein [Actinomycetospora sp. Odt1-22]